MKTFRLWAFSFLAFTVILLCAARAADTNPPPRLTVELRDGSRVVGESVEKTFRFHSALLGDIKLDAKNVRTLECVSTNAVKLTTASGDTLMLSPIGAAVAVKTGFGRVQLAAESIRKITVSSAGALAGGQRVGLVAWWKGEGDVRDSVGESNGMFKDGVTFVPGKSGQGFNFNGHGNVEVPDNPSLNPSREMTVECWVYPRARPYGHWSQHLVSKDNGCYEPRQFNLILGDNSSGGGRGVFRTSICLSSGFLTIEGKTTLRADEWYHVAMTYDGTVLKLYVNGKVDAEIVASGQIMPSPEPVRIGGGAAAGCPTYNFNGIIDEPVIYNRSLSADEIQQDCNTAN